ncbi:uncharacterized protein K02A2.6 [Trichonephila clavata]|uniref:Uncharacterized protein K02A2.6 n=1 Tax=Trichonephila clavata TaxID=2740835 RepID=A0A8X6KAC5_TRICU|nr:uncharacterized protein K02A2.6 [Trichonephila clavata]
MCGVILYPLVESSLPINVLRSFERQRKSLENELKLSSLDALIHFLKNEVETEEKIRLSRTDIFHFSSERKNAAPANSRDRKPSATELFISHKSNDNLCMFCFKNHETRSCKKAYFIPLDEKLLVIKRKGLCRICLTKGHLAKLCSSSIKCNLCSERHLKLMCPNLEVNKLDQIPKQTYKRLDSTYKKLDKTGYREKYQQVFGEWVEEGVIEEVSCDSYFWTDSSTVLTWIKRQEQWSVFVNNRIVEIRRLTPPENWFHVPGNQNPADILSRGCGPRQLLKSEWWLGPTWLKKSEEDWPKSFGSVNEEEVEKEKRKIVVSASNIEFKSTITLLATRISKFSKIVRVLAWILRFQPKAKNLRKHANLTQEEIMEAQKTLLRSAQKECFNEEGRKSLKNFQVFTDNDGILGLKSRIANEDELPEFIAPLILPPKHLVIKRLIEQEHLFENLNSVVLS